MRDTVLKKRLMVLVVIVVAIIVGILVISNQNGQSDKDSVGAASAAPGAVQNEGFVVEDTATVQVDIDDEQTSGPAAGE
jgi:uncharacterized protein (UPF0333 family)